MSAREMRDATLMLRRPTAVDRIKENIPIPPGALPKNGLPLWNRFPVGFKLPIIKHPKDAFVLYRDKLGRGLWRSSPVGEFRLDDPYMHDVDYAYEPVHDPALRRLFQSEEFRNILLSRGFILPTEEAVCSLKQFNTYRRYLATIYRDVIQDRYRRQAVDLSDEQAIRKARQCEEKQLEASLKRLEREKKQEETRTNQEALRQQKLQQIVARQTRYLELLKRLEDKKEQDRREAIERSRELDKKVKYRQAVAAEIQRAKVIATIQAWNRDKKERTARLEQQQQQLQEYKEGEVARQWQAKIQCQSEREVREKELLAREEEARRLGVELRNKKLEREDLRMQVLLKKIRAEQERERDKRFRLRPAHRKRPGVARGGPSASGSAEDKPKRRRRVASSGYIVDDDMPPLDRAFNASLRMVKEAREQGASCLIGDNLWRQFRATGFDPSETRDGLPEAVATALDGLFDAVMEGIVRRMVMQTLKCVYHKILVRCFTLLENLPVREMARRGWVCDHGMLKHTKLRARAVARRERECRPRDPPASEAEVPDDAPTPAPTEAVSKTAGPRKKRGRRGRPRIPERLDSEEERQRILQKIEAIERKNQQLKKALERTASLSSEASLDDEEAAMDLDANFDIMSKGLQKKMVTIAAQSVSEETKLATQHRWKMMKEVELFELVDRLCVMMMNKTPVEFLDSTEFNWAADILARDVMREVRHQVRQNHRQKEKERLKRAREAELAARRAPPPMARQVRAKLEKELAARQGARREGAASERSLASSRSRAPAPPPAPVEPEPLDVSQVPLLRLHKRSPHQPSLPSLDSLAADASTIELNLHHIAKRGRSSL